MRKKILVNGLRLTVLIIVFLTVMAGCGRQELRRADQEKNVDAEKQPTVTDATGDDYSVEEIDGLILIKANGFQFKILKDWDFVGDGNSFVIYPKNTSLMNSYNNGGVIISANTYSSTLDLENYLLTIWQKEYLKITQVNNNVVAFINKPNFYALAFMIEPHQYTIVSLDACSGIDCRELNNELDKIIKESLTIN